MRTLISRLIMMIHPDRRTLSELADLLSRRKRAASWWDHSHITRRLARLEDAEEYSRLPAEKRYVLLQAARFSAHYYSVATLPVLALAIVNAGLKDCQYRQCKTLPLAPG